MSPTSCAVSRLFGGLGDLSAALKYGQADEEIAQKTSGLVVCCGSDFCLYKTLLLNCLSSCKHISKICKFIYRGGIFWGGKCMAWLSDKLEAK